MTRTKHQARNHQQQRKLNALSLNRSTAQILEEILAKKEGRKPRKKYIWRD